MLIKGDIKCLHCGFVSGEWVGPSGAPLTFAGFRPATAGDGRDPRETVHCLRCDGPVVLEDASPVLSSRRIQRIRRLREQIAALEAEQRPGKGRGRAA